LAGDALAAGTVFGEVIVGAGAAAGLPVPQVERPGARGGSGRSSSLLSGVAGVGASSSCALVTRGPV
jgi:hypothetical protein